MTLTRPAIRCSRPCSPAAKELASEYGLPAYVFSPDPVLLDMGHQCPATLAELRTIPGVGAKKLETWGRESITVVRAHMQGSPNPVDRGAASWDSWSRPSGGTLYEQIPRIDLRRGAAGGLL